MVTNGDYSGLSGDKTDKQKEAYISLSEFDRETGLPSQLISRELIDLEKRNIIKRIRSKAKPVKYSFQKDCKKWILTSGALERRNRIIRGSLHNRIDEETKREIEKDRERLGLNNFNLSEELPNYGY